MLSLYKIEPLICGTTEIGGSLHWDNCSQNLYYVDLYGPSVYRYDPTKNTTYKATIENETTVSFIIPVENRPTEFAVGSNNHVSIIEWNGIDPSCKVTSIMAQVEIDYEDNRFNEAKADPNGRFVGGTMRSEKVGNIFDVRHGKLYKIDRRGQPTVVLKNKIGVCSGLAWNIPNKKFYFIDSCDYNIKEYDYCRETGEISNPNVICNLRPPNYGRIGCIPYGMTIDSEGLLYVAGNGGSVIFQINPEDGNIEKEIEMPCEQITSVAFGGPNLDILFATSSSDGCKEPPAGETFKITGLGVKGVPMHNLKL